VLLEAELCSGLLNDLAWGSSGFEPRLCFFVSWSSALGLGLVLCGGARAWLG
jgi:hypothetical protein